MSNGERSCTDGRCTVKVREGPRECAGRIGRVSDAWVWDEEGSEEWIESVSEDAGEASEREVRRETPRKVVAIYPCSAICRACHHSHCVRPCLVRLDNVEETA